MKQLASTPEGLYAMPITSNRDDVTAAALGDNSRDAYALHLVNNGTTREVSLKGIPEDVARLRIYVTDSEREMEEGEPVDVTNGTATFTLHSMSYTTLRTEN